MNIDRHLSAFQEAPTLLSTRTNRQAIRAALVEESAQPLNAPEAVRADHKAWASYRDNLRLPPLACGLETHSDHASIVVVSRDPSDILVAATFSDGASFQTLEEWLEKMSAHFRDPICCAVDGRTTPLSNPVTRWPRCVIYRDGPADKYYPPDGWIPRIDGSEIPEIPPWTRQTYLKALALARQLKADLDEIQACLIELDLLRKLEARLRCLFANRFPPHLQKAIELHDTHL